MPLPRSHLLTGNLQRQTIASASTIRGSNSLSLSHYAYLIDSRQMMATSTETTTETAVTIGVNGIGEPDMERVDTTAVAMMNSHGSLQACLHTAFTRLVDLIAGRGYRAACSLPQSFNTRCQMAKKSDGSNSDRSDPRKNKSLAIRMVIKRMPSAKASEVVAAVKKEFGHNVKKGMVYMVKTKANMAADGRPKRQAGSRSDSPITSAAQWVEAIKLARQLLKATGSVANATALLKAIE